MCIRDRPYGIGSFIMGGLYAVTVVAGIHHMYTLIDLGQLARYGYTCLLYTSSLRAAGRKFQAAKVLCEVWYGSYNSATNITCFRDFFTNRPLIF